MKISRIYYGPQFIKEFKRLLPDKQQQVYRKEKIFKQNPFSPTLKTHKLMGKLTGQWSFSISYQDRIIFEFLKGDEVVFVKIGSHAIYS